MNPISYLQRSDRCEIKQTYCEITNKKQDVNVKFAPAKSQKE